MKLDSALVKQAVTLEAIVSHYGVKLNPHGSGELIGLCPLHKEKTPSFTVTPSKGLFFCFGCQKSGDVFRFVEEIEHLSFPEALDRVAEIAGLNPESYQEDPTKPKPVSSLAGSKPSVVATYRYTDEAGELIYEKLRVEPAPDGSKKTFRYRRRHPIDECWVNGLKAGKYRKGSNNEWYALKAGEPEDGGSVDELPECRRPLYWLPEVISADIVVVSEGEKDADTGREMVLPLGWASTTTGGVSGEWTAEQKETLRDKRVYLFSDDNEVGRRRAKQISGWLKGIVSECFIIDVPRGSDLTAYKELGGTISELVESIEGALRRAQVDAIEKRGLLSPLEILDHYEYGYEGLLNPASVAPGLMTGFHGLDEITFGFHKGDLIILAARPAMGKTVWALNVGENVAGNRTSKDSVAVFTLEMSREQLIQRMLCSMAGVDSHRFRKGHLRPEERKEMAIAFDKLSEMPIFFDDVPLISVDIIRRKLLNLRERSRLDLVIIDYLQLMDVKAKENRNQEIGALSRGLKIMAREFKVPFLVLSQLSRAVETRTGDHRPQLSDLRDSGSIEQDADMVMFLFREEYYKRDREDLKGVAELIIAKQRNGPVGTVKLQFQHALTRFVNPAEPWRQEEAA